jgi:hypothetical protein
MGSLCTGLKPGHWLRSAGTVARYRTGGTTATDSRAAFSGSQKPGGVYLWVDNTWPAGGDTLERAFLPAQAGG